ncbi:MAG TPA: acyl-CoA dehydrogenase family protein [Myxococcota bacterium]|nr:acyl-CoA dehydrogenase family protein [Myxococcota bacterium]
MAEAVSERVADYLERVKALEPVVREHAARSEAESRLAAPIVEALHQSGLFRMLLPRSLGGSELSIPESLRVFEAMARIDASTAWNLAICADAPIFAHFTEREAFETIFRDPRAVMVGTLNPATTRAVECEGGYRFSGRGTYLSGSAQATWMTAAGLRMRDGKPVLVDGAPSLRTGIFPIAHARFEDTWRVSGMRGTGSHDCTFEDVFVPDAFTYDWANPESRWKGGAFSKIPLTTQLGGALASVAVGVAQHALDALTELARTKVPVGMRSSLRDRPIAQVQVAQAAGAVRAARAYLFATNDELWRRGEAGGEFDFEVRAAARLASVTAVKLCAQAIDLVHEAAGMTAVSAGHELERCWRDLHTLSQHVILSSSRYEVIGRIMFGLDPASPII